MSTTAHLQKCLTAGLGGGSPLTAATTTGDLSRDLQLRMSQTK